ncbi:MAG: thiol peroxidase [Planctomycetes bacterium]|nr:thiol peroxidase [Planctomycetota bacterium]
MTDAKVTFKGNPVKLAGHPPKVGDAAPDFAAVATDLSTKKLSDFKGRVVLLSSVPSLDTGVCDTETRRFSQEIGKLGDAVILLTVSRDLPFAQKRWCGGAGVTNVVALSDFRDRAFGKAYGVEMTDGPLAGLLARTVTVIGKDGKVRYHQTVPEIATEPDYDKALAAAKAG